MRKKFITIFNQYADETYLYRDVGMIAYCMGKECGWKSSFAYLQYLSGSTISNEEYSKYVDIIPIANYSNKLKRDYMFFKFLYYVSKNYDVVSFYSLGIKARRNALILKIFNPKIKIYVKSDASTAALDGYHIKSFNKNRLQAWFFRWMEKNIDITSFETPDALQKATESAIVQNSAICIPNGYLEDVDLHYKKHNKENIIITVGRIGSAEKYNELLVDAVKDIAKEKIKNWKVYFVGPVTEEFKEYIDFACKDREYLKDIFLTTGNIVNKKELFKIYAKAKVFCLTSRREGFANVFPESLSFGNYLITSNVPVADYVTDNGRLGKVFPIGDVLKLRQAIEDVLDEKIDLEQERLKAEDFAKSTLNWKNIIKTLEKEINKIS